MFYAQLMSYLVFRLLTILTVSIIYGFSLVKWDLSPINKCFVSPITLVSELHQYVKTDPYLLPSTKLNKQSNDLSLRPGTTDMIEEKVENILELIAYS